jgi:hypothetical protein
MTNNLQQEKPAPTTGPNPGAVSVGDYANKHTSPTGPAASNARNASNSNCTGTRLGGKRWGTMPHCARACEWNCSNPRGMHRGEHRLALQSNSRATPYLLLCLVILAPLASARSITSLATPSLEIDGPASSTVELAGLSMKDYEENFSILIGGQAKITTEFIDGEIGAGQVGFGGSASTETNF